MDESFSVELSVEAEKGLKSVQKNNAVAILKKLHSISSKPFRFLERLRGIELYKLRIGDYRAIIHADNKKRVLVVVKIGHRKDIYNKL